MSANPCVDPCGAQQGDLGEAVYFGSREGRLFGWLHRPTSSKFASNVGVVICNPFGYEAMCSHRSVRALADSAAALGVPAIRFDYLGTGDSAEIDPAADQISEWTHNVLAAVDELRLRTGVERVFLLGFRLGGLLAALAAKQVVGLAGLAVVAPVISGQRYLRELRTARMASLSAHESSSNDPAAADKGQPAGSIEFSGFTLSAATLATLKSVDLIQLGAPVTEVLVVDASSLPMGRVWSDKLTDAGTPVQYSALPGILEMIVTPRQYGVTSPALITAFGDWLQLCMNRMGDAAEHRLHGADADAPASLMTLPGAAASPNRQVIERPIFFGAQSLLFGIVTEPSPDEKRRRAVILLNAGADHHIGVSRVHVPLARRWARNGYYVLRMDLGGIGDSATRSASADDVVFPPTALEDIRAAIDYLTTHYGIRDVTLAGLCSGAYHALRASIAGAAVTRILMVNPQNFFWKDGMELEDLQVAEVIRNPAVYRKRVVSGAAWKKLLKGQVNVWRIIKVMVQRTWLPMESTLRDLARRARLRLPNDLGWELEAVAARGVQVVFVFAHGEPGLDLLKMQAGSSVTRLGALCRVRIIASGDHTFSHRGPRNELEAVLTEELFAEPISGLRAAPQGFGRHRDAVG